jgi:isocitrate dehydrogenase kinase/phosphatase
MQHHADFFDPALWQRHKDHLLKGELPDFFPYDSHERFCIRYPERFADASASASPDAPHAPPDERSVRVA